MEMDRKSFVAVAIIMGFLSLAFLQAWSPIGAASTVAASVGAMALEERSLKDSITDRKMKLDLLGELSQIGLGIFIRVNVTVVEGRVFLTVVVDTDDQRLNVPKLHGGTKMCVMSSMKY